MPRGVYPRRKLGRPASSVKPAAKPDPRLKLDKWPYVDSDPKVLEAEQKIKDLNQLINEARFKANKASNKSLDYKRVINVLEDKVSTYQCSTEEQDNFVKEATGEHLECIVGGFDHVIKELKASMLRESREYVKQSDTLAELEAAETALRKTWIDLRSKAADQWVANQPKPEVEK